MGVNNSFYIAQSLFSDPLAYSQYFNQLPNDISALRSFCANTFSHFNLIPLNKIKNYYNNISKNKRYLNTHLEYIFSHKESLLQEKPVGICRDSALLLCSVLRSRKIPARLRVGFVSYYHEDLWLDGFALEYFDSRSGLWKQVDSGINDIIVSKYKISNHIDFTDLSSNEFITAAKAWQLVRQNELNEDLFRSGKYFGLKIIRNRMIQDLHCLLKIEPLLWDLWGDMFLSNINLDLYDKLAALLINHHDDINKIQDFYRLNECLKISRSVLEDNPKVGANWLSEESFYARD